MIPGDLARLTASRLKAARTCPRLHQYEYVLGYRPAQDAAALRFGTLIHEGLEAWWLARGSGADCLGAALAATEGEAEPYDLARARVLLTGYHLRWRDEPLEPLAVEMEFSTPLLNPRTGYASRIWKLAGKLDAVVRDMRTGEVCIMEHKTSGEDISAGSDYWKRLRMDGQVSVYFEGARALGFEPTRCIYDVLGKPKLRPLEANGRRDTKESPAEFEERLAAAVAEEPGRYFARGDVVRLEDEMEGAMLDIWQMAQRLREDERLGRAPKNPDSCTRYGRTCAYWPVCTGEASLEDERLYRKPESAHPELSGESGVEAERSST